MYAYVMRPEILPRSYYTFIQRYAFVACHSSEFCSKCQFSVNCLSFRLVRNSFVRTGPISEPILQAVRTYNRGRPIDVAAVLADVHSANPASPLQSLSPLPSVLPCTALHPKHSSCTVNYFHVVFSVAKKIIPLYATLTFVPMVALQWFCTFTSFYISLAELWRRPVATLSHFASSTLRSTVFLCCFTSWYQVCHCPPNPYFLTHLIALPTPLLPPPFISTIFFSFYF